MSFVEDREPDKQAQQQGLWDQWQSWLDKGENRAAVLQFGLNLMQPIPAGQSFAGHFATAIGGGAEAAERVRRGELEERIAEEEFGLKREKQQAEVETARTGAQIAREELALKKEEVGPRRRLTMAEAGLREEQARGLPEERALARRRVSIEESTEDRLRKQFDETTDANLRARIAKHLSAADIQRNAIIEKEMEQNARIIEKARTDPTLTQQQWEETLKKFPTTYFDVERQTPPEVWNRIERNMEERIRLEDEDIWKLIQKRRGAAKMEVAPQAGAALPPVRREVPGTYVPPKSPTAPPTGRAVLPTPTEELAPYSPGIARSFGDLMRGRPTIERVLSSEPEVQRNLSIAKRMVASDSEKSRINGQQYIDSVRSKVSDPESFDTYVRNLQIEAPIRAQQPPEGQAGPIQTFDQVMRDAGMRAALNQKFLEFTRGTDPAVRQAAGDFLAKLREMFKRSGDARGVAEINKVLNPTPGQ